MIKTKSLALLFVVLGSAPALAAPTVNITTQVNGSVAGMLQLNGTASDSIAISSVEITVDNVRFGLATGTNSWSFSMNTNYTGNGSHSVVATATDASGNTGTASLSINVANPIVVQSQKSGVGTNTNQVSCYSSEEPFLDVFKTAYSNCSAGTPMLNGWLTTGGTYTSLNLDEDGWVKSMSYAGGTFTSAGAWMLRSLAAYPSGNYVVLYKGEGTLAFSGDVGSVVSISSNSLGGRYVISVSPTYNPLSRGIEVLITATDPSATGNYLRNIQVVSSPDSTPAHVGVREQSLIDGAIFDPAYLAKMAPFSEIRFMQWGAVNNGANNLPAFTQTNRPLPSNAFWSSNSGVPAEIMIALVNQTGADAWINIPTNAATPSNDSYVTWLAHYAHASLGKAQKVYLEYANEVWNGRIGPMETLGAIVWPTQPVNFTLGANYYGMRTALNCDEWHSAWGSDASRVICVMGNQVGNYGVVQGELDCTYWSQAPCAGNHGITAIADAPYFGSPNGKDPTTFVNDPDGGVSRFCQAFTTPNLDPNSPRGYIADIMKNLANDYSFVSNAGNIAKYGKLSIVSYEGGPSVVSTQTAVANMYFNFYKSACMGTVYTNFLNQYKAAGYQMFTNFSDFQPVSRSWPAFDYGIWGFADDVWQDTTTSPSPKYAALTNFIANNACWWPGCGSASGNSTLYVSISTPAANATVFGTITVAGTATDNANVTLLQISTNSGTTYNPITGSTSSWTYSLNTSSMSVGAHTITVKATDSTGATATATRIVNVSSSSLTVLITTPTANAAVFGTITVAGTTTDNANVTLLQISTNNSTTYNPITGSTASWTYSLDTSSMSIGAHTITVQAKDSSGNTATATQAITVSNATAPGSGPTVTITNQINGNVTGIVNLSGTATDSVGVVSVAIAVDSVSYGPAFGTTTWSYPFNTNYVGNTQHTITATATDLSGNSASASLTLTVANPQLHTQTHPHSGIAADTAGISYYGAEQPFLDIFKTAYGNPPSNINDLLHGWFTGSPSGGQLDVNLDANGWPVSMTGVSGTTYGSISVLIIPGNNYPTGTYVVRYQGTGSLAYNFDVSLSSHSPGRDILNAKNSGAGFQISITNTDPNHTGDYIRNIQLVYSPDSTATHIGTNEQALINGTVFNPLYLATMAPFSEIRFMEWGQVNNAVGNMPTYTSTQRPLPSQAFWDSNSGVPAELMIALANQTGADAWISIPTYAATPTDDSYVRWLAAYAAKNLGAGQRVYLEYANEMWNGRVAPEAAMAKTLWPNAGASTGSYAQSYYGMRQALDCQEWKRAWSNQGRNASDVVCVMGNQISNSGVVDGELRCALAVAGTPVPPGAGVTWNGPPCASNYGISAIADAPYFPYPSPSSTTIHSEQDVCNAVTAGVPAILSGLASDMNYLKNSSNVALFGPLSLVSYEGGPSLTGAKTTALQTNFYDFWTSTCMYSAYTTFLQQYQAAGYGLYNNFDNFQTLNLASFNNGQWGNLDDIWQTTSRAATPKYQALVDFLNSGAVMSGVGSTLAVTISSPIAGATITGVVTVKGTSSDNATVQTVSISTDGVDFYAATGTATWTYSLNSFAMSNGAQTITAKALDSSGYVLTTQTQVTVNNPGISVAISTPIAGTTVFGTIPVSGTASDGSGRSLTRVAIAVDSGTYATATGTAAWTYSLNTTSLSLGAHTIYVQANDSATSFTASVPVIVTRSSSALTVAITAPSTGTTVSGTITVTGITSDTSTVTAVLISTDGMHFSPVNNGSLTNWSYRLNTNGVSNGPQSLYVQATDNAGNTAFAQTSIVVANAAVAAVANTSLVYPNPVTSGSPVIRAVVNAPSTVSITVYNIAGRVVYSATMNGSPTGMTPGGQYYYDHVWSGHVASGVYFATIHSVASNGSESNSRAEFAVVR